MVTSGAPNIRCSEAHMYNVFDTLKEHPVQVMADWSAVTDGVLSFSGL